MQHRYHVDYIRSKAAQTATAANIMFISGLPCHFLSLDHNSALWFALPKNNDIFNGAIPIDSRYKRIATAANRHVFVCPVVD